MSFNKLYAKKPAIDPNTGLPYTTGFQNVQGQDQYKNDPTKVGEQIMSAYNGSIESFEFWGLKRSGNIFPKDVVLSPGYFFGKQVVIAVSRDITKQKAATEGILAGEACE